MNQTNRIRWLALAGGILWVGAANATSICEIDLLTTPLNFTNTGVCGQVDTELGGVPDQNIDESASVASASAQQGTNPPVAGSDGTSGTANATYPDPDGTGGSVGAASFVSGGGGTSGPISTISTSFYIGEFIADNGPGSNDPFNLAVNLDITGELSLQNQGTATLAIVFAAVDAGGNELDSFFGFAILDSLIGFFPLGFTDPLFGFTQSGVCPLNCTVTADTSESMMLGGLFDGDVFGLFLTIETTATVPSGVGVSAAHANFANTIELSFPDGGVTALPATLSVPEPASMALVIAGMLMVGFARRRGLF